jgi:polyisoprenoid-binding protein YceI
MSTTTYAQRTVPAGKWAADRTHSSATFEVGHLGVSTFRGAVKDFDATLEVSDDRFELDGGARVESFDVDEPNLKGHLLSPEFFDAERHPEIRFRAGELVEDADGLVVKGELEIRGNSNPVDARAEVGEVGAGPDGVERVELVLSTTIDRTEYGLGWNMDLPNGGKTLADEVGLTVVLELVREDA